MTNRKNNQHRSHHFWIAGFLILCTSMIVHGYVVGLDERNLVNLPTYKITRAKTFFVDIGHRFDTEIENDGNFEPLWYEFLGMDDNADLMMSISYGVGNLFDITIARYGFTKLYATLMRFSILNEPIDHTPFSLAVEINNGIRTKETIDHSDRYTAGANVVLAKNFFVENLYVGLVSSFQYNTSGFDYYESEDEDWTLSQGGNVAVRFGRLTIAVEYNYPLAGFWRQNEDQIVTDNFGVSVGYTTYQHNFSLCLNNHGFNFPGDMIAGAQTMLSDSKTHLRLGFNITREIDFLTHDKESKQ